MKEESLTMYYHFHGVDTHRVTFSTPITKANLKSWWPENTIYWIR